MHGKNHAKLEKKFIQQYLVENRKLSDDGQMLTDEIVSLFKAENVSLRLFERVGVAPRRIRSVSSPTSFKPEVRASWKWPKPIPEDLFGKSFGGTDYQWIIMGSAYTGTKCHQDPDMTDAWNALIKGHKYWVVFPKDMYVEEFNCNPECSDEPGEAHVFSLPWYKNVLPQLRQKTWYGQKLIETIQVSIVFNKIREKK